ncbi:MAG: hypothetical protein SGPRY_013005 [Prymnesium sp.]
MAMGLDENGIAANSSHVLIPSHALHQDAAAARTSALELADLGYQIASSELVGLRAEKKLTQKFRAPQSLAVITAASQLLAEVDAAVRPSAIVPPDWTMELQTAIDEVSPVKTDLLRPSGISRLGVIASQVKPMACSSEANDDELDDEI